MNSLWKLLISAGVCAAYFASDATAEPYNFMGRNFCLTEDARTMTREGAPYASGVNNAPKSFRLTFGPVKDKDVFAAEVEGSDLPIINGQYTSTAKQPGLLVKDFGVGFAWALMSTGEVNFIVPATTGEEETHVWLTVSAQCYKADG